MIFTARPLEWKKYTDLRAILKADCILGFFTIQKSFEKQETYYLEWHLKGATGFSKGATANIDILKNMAEEMLHHELKKYFD